MLTGSGHRAGLSGKPWRGIDPSSKGPHWAIPRALLNELEEDLSGLNQHEKLDRLPELGLITMERSAYWLVYQHDTTPQDGTPVSDVWAFQPYPKGTVFGTDDDVYADVRLFSDRDRERLAHLTQKPPSRPPTARHAARELIESDQRAV